MVLRFVEQFGVSTKELGQLRTKFVSKTEKAFKNVLNYRSAYIPIVQEEERAPSVLKYLVKTDAQQKKERYLLFSAEVNGMYFKNLVAYLSPIYASSWRGDVYFEEYSYLSLLPYPCDDLIGFIEYRAGLASKKEFYSIPSQVPKIEVKEEDLFQSSSQDSIAFQLAETLQNMRLSPDLRDDLRKTRKKERSYVCEYLNKFKGLNKKVKKITAMSEVRKQKGNVIYSFKDRVGLTTILLPVKDKTIVQVGDFDLNPKRDIETLNTIAEALHGAHLDRPQGMEYGSD
ncbi:MAG: hypothetical protein ACETWM_07755 [Candidatus Lokiarchaeia archaeon]